MKSSKYYLFRIIGHSILCELPFELSIHNEAEDFLHPFGDAENFCACSKDSYDFIIRLRLVEKLPDIPVDSHSNGGKIFGRINRHTFIFTQLNYRDQPYACTVYSDDSNEAEILFRPDYAKYTQYSRQFMNHVLLEVLFLQLKSIILHASFIRWQGQGILFSAPSGTGKSTQADLWSERFQAEILNGDRAGLRQVDGVWTAYGLPYAGSSGIYRNESAPVRAIVLLRQAKENRITRVSPAVALCSLYPEVLIHRWDKEFSAQALNLLENLIASVPVYLLECLPNQEAAELTCQTLFPDRME